MTAPPGALVLGADYRGLGIVRSLGRQGIRVWVIREHEEPLASLSRYAERRFVWPSRDPRARAELLVALAKAHGLDGWALFPTTDEAVAMLCEHHAVLAEHYRHTTADWPVVRWAYDKALTYELADRVGVGCPATAYPRTAAEAADVPLPMPVVLKPTVKQEFNRLTVAKAWRVDTVSELVERFAEAAELVDPSQLMVQEVVPGGGAMQLSYAALCIDGVPVASIGARRTRQYPADFGRASTFVETMSCAEAADAAARLLKEVGFTGLIEVEFKRDPRDGELKLLDMNPRVWGWHTLAGRAGVDFPMLQWRALCGETITPPPWREGVGWLRLATDTPTAWREIAAGRLSLREYLRTLCRPREAAIWAWDDPMPGLAEVPVLLYVMLRRLLRGRGV